MIYLIILAAVETIGALISFGIQWRFSGYLVNPRRKQLSWAIIVLRSLVWWRLLVELAWDRRPRRAR